MAAHEQAPGLGDRIWALIADLNDHLHITSGSVGRTVLQQSLHMAPDVLPCAQPLHPQSLVSWHWLGLRFHEWGTYNSWKIWN